MIAVTWRAPTNEERPPAGSGRQDAELLNEQEKKDDQWVAGHPPPPLGGRCRRARLPSGRRSAAFGSPRQPPIGPAAQRSGGCRACAGPPLGSPAHRGAAWGLATPRPAPPRLRRPCASGRRQRHAARDGSRRLEALRRLACRRSTQGCPHRVLVGSALHLYVSSDDMSTAHSNEFPGRLRLT